MANNKAGIVCLTAIVLAVWLDGSAHAKESHVSKGMKIEDALFVVKQCVVEATSFQAYRTNNFKKLRAEDTLEYVGITDATRMNAFRRFLVRNTNFGVQSIWGSRDGNYRPYLVSVSALDGIKKSMKLEEVARLIVKQAGLPFMTPGKAAEITSYCRAQGTRVNESVPTSRGIAADFAMLPARAKFDECVLDKKHGVESLGVIDGEGDFYRYQKDSVENEVKTAATYGDVVTALYKKAAVTFGTGLSAEIIVKAGIMQTIGCEKVSFPIVTFCQNISVDPDLIFSNLTFADVATRSNQVIGTTLPLVLNEFHRRDAETKQTIPDLAEIQRASSTKVGRAIGDIKKTLEGKKTK
jgi:hypothetical protein